MFLVNDIESGRKINEADMTTSVIRWH